MGFRPGEQDACSDTFLAVFFVQLLGPEILCHRLWAFGIRVGRGCLSRLRLMHPDTAL